MCANAGLGNARELAVDRRYASLQLCPVAAVAVRYTSVNNLKVVPAGGEPALSITASLQATYKSSSSALEKQRINNHVHVPGRVVRPAAIAERGIA